MEQKRIWIGGQWRKSHARGERVITNPATLLPLAVVPDCGASDVDAAVSAAVAAQKAWWRTPGPEKARLLRQVGARIRGMEHELVETMVAETGKPYWEAKDCIEWVAACFEYYSEVGRRSHGNSVPPVAPHQINFTIKEPYGVVAAIAPFNFPLLLMAWKVAPALAAGNAIVAKAPHQNPLSNLKMAEALSDLPSGVFNLLTGAAETGQALIAHPGVDLVAFTGSSETGRKVAAQAGSLLKKTNLELGGIDPFIVFEDADLEIAVRGVAWARLLNAGQVCTSSKRIYVVDAVADEFEQKIVDHVKTLRVGNPQDSSVDVGPLISLEALTKLEAQVKALLSEGAVLRHGGSRIQPNGLPGHFFAPTVLTGVRHGGTATTEEIFGPVISIIRVQDATEAIRLANDSPYGLGASVYTRSLELALHSMEEIKAGTFWINDPLTDNDAAPFGGMRWSGVGRELGEEGLDAFREPKHVHLDYRMEPKPWWYPYGARK
jgi:acyl-CoA reductase-like NAD-dependent aldehyde dehydrogenase